MLVMLYKEVQAVHVWKTENYVFFLQTVDVSGFQS